MNLESFIIKLEEIVRNQNVKEFNLFIEDENASHHDFKIEVDRVNNDITLSVK